MNGKAFPLSTFFVSQYPNTPHTATSEWQSARAAYSKVMADARWVTSNFELQNICAGLGLQPSLGEIEKALSENSGHLDFEGLLRFVTYMKTKFHTPDPPDMDTVRAFVAVGGGLDKSGNIAADILVQTCKKFDLDIHLEGLMGSPKVEVEEERRASTASHDPSHAESGEGQERCFAFQDFSDMFDQGASNCILSDDESDDGDSEEVGDCMRPAVASPRLNLGIDYDRLLEKEIREKGLPTPRVRRPTDLLARHQSFTSNTASAPLVAPADNRRRSRRTSGGGGRNSLCQNLPSVNQGHTEKLRYHAELRAKGVPLELYGGDANAENDSSDVLKINSNGESVREKGGEGKGGRKRKALPSSAKAHNSPQTILGAGTRVIGRSGLFVDDPPKLYPQHLAAMSLPPLPPVRAGTVKSRTGQGNGLLSSIEKYVGNITPNVSYFPPVLCHTFKGAQFCTVVPRPFWPSNTGFHRHTSCDCLAQWLSNDAVVGSIPTAAGFLFF